MNLQISIVRANYYYIEAFLRRKNSKKTLPFENNLLILQQKMYQTPQTHKYMLQIRCKNINVTKSFPEGTSLLDVYQEFADEIKLPYPVVSARVNNVSEGLKFRLFQNRDVEFMDAREGSGHRVYALTPQTGPFSH